MYLLSFLLWIRGVNTITDDLNDSLPSGLTGRSGLSSNRGPYSILADLDLPSTSSTRIHSTTFAFDNFSDDNEDSLLGDSSLPTSILESALSRSNQTSSPTTTRITTGSSSGSNRDWSHTNFELSVKTLCITHKFAVFLFRVFVFIVAVLRLFTMFVNLFTSVCFHFKFRHEYYNAFQVSFRGRFIF